VTVDPARPFAWTSVPDAQAYRLLVGLTRGGSDLIDTGATKQTSRAMGALPARQLLFARVMTYANQTWLSSDIAFMIGSASSASVAKLVYPAAGAVNADTRKPFSWTSVPGAQAYRLHAGMTSGGSELFDTGEIQETSHPMASLPTGRTIYARLWTKTSGAWLYTEINFSAASSSSPEPVARAPVRTVQPDRRRPVRLSPVDSAFVPAQIVYPVPGSSLAGPDVTFQWTAVAGAEAYALEIGSSPGAADLLSSGPTQATSFVAYGLPAGATFYARLSTQFGGQSLFVDSVFLTTVAPDSLLITVAYPQAGEGMDAGLPFEWSASLGVDAYRLQIGTSPAAGDLDDSGEIRVNRRFVAGLPQGTQLFGRAWAEVGGTWSYADFTFQVTSETAPFSHRLDSALWATDFVRQMAPNNVPLPSTELYAVAGGDGAACTDYAQALLNILLAMNSGLPAQVVNTCMNSSNRYDCHTLIQVSADGGLTWILLDPTFDITVQRASDGSWATVQDISASTRAFDWAAMNYVFLGPRKDFFLTGYYIDYPLLYLNPLDTGAAQDVSETPYLQAAALPIQNQLGTYVLRSVSKSNAGVSIDGSERQVTFSGADALSRAIYATAVLSAPDSPPDLQAFRLLRFVF
jgi:hypothetical protein